MESGLTTGGEVRLVVGQGLERGRVFALRQPAVTIGRTDENDVVLRDRGVSRHHARLQQSPGGWVLADLGSTNGTYVNGRRLRQGHLLQAGDEVVIGGAVLIVQKQEGTTRPPPPGSRHEEHARTGPPRTLMVLIALALILVLSGLVFLMVTALMPPAEPTSPTPVDATERMMTSLPVPTQLQEMMTDVVPLIPTEFHIIPLGATPGATPEAMLQPGRRTQPGNQPVAVRLPVVPEATNHGAAPP